MRIVTRPDFDGVVCAVLLFDALKINEPVKWIEPYELKEKGDKIIKGDIIANLPYHENCSLWFDHHFSNKTDKPFKGYFQEAPSAAGVIFNYYKDKFSRDFSELVRNTDQIDSANFTVDEVLYPEKYPYILLYFTISGRDKADEIYWNSVVDILGKYDIDQVLKEAEVIKKCKMVIEQDRIYKNYLNDHTTENGNVSITDFRSLHNEPKGNRFLVYSIFPNSLYNIKIRYKKNDGNKVIISLGQNIFNRAGKVNLGSLVSKFGGGGHPGAGSCSFHISESKKNITKIIDILSKDQKID